MVPEPGCRDDFDGSAEQRCTLTHAAQAQLPIGIHREPGAVIAHPQLDHARVEPDADAGCARPRMLRHVGQRFLQQPVDRGLEER